MRLFLIRGLVAIAWVGAFAAVSDSLTTGVAILLVAYPVIDLVGSLIDARQQDGSARRLLHLSAGAGAAEAVAVAVAATGDIADVLIVLAVWAAVTGAAQLATAVRAARRSACSGRCCSPVPCPLAPASRSPARQPALIRRWTRSCSTRPPAGRSSSSRPRSSHVATAQLQPLGDTQSNPRASEKSAREHNHRRQHEPARATSSRATLGRCSAG